MASRDAAIDALAAGLAAHEADTANPHAVTAAQVGAYSTAQVDAQISGLSATYSPLAGSTALDTLGAVATGTWQATPIGVAYGGTGATTAAGARAALDTYSTAEVDALVAGAGGSVAIGDAIGGATAGRVLVVGTGPVIAEGPYYDATNDRLGVGVATPRESLHVGGQIAVGNPELAYGRNAISGSDGVFRFTDQGYGAFFELTPAHGGSKNRWVCNTGNMTFAADIYVGDDGGNAKSLHVNGGATLTPAGLGAGASVSPLTTQGVSGQSAPQYKALDPVGATLYAIGPDGDIRTSWTSAATTPGAILRRLPIYDAAGTLLGYIPIYDDIS